VLREIVSQHHDGHWRHIHQEMNVVDQDEIVAPPKSRKQGARRHQQQTIASAQP
jgi:hypothetical protein